MRHGSNSASKNLPIHFLYLFVFVCPELTSSLHRLCVQCDQPNVYKSCPKMISLQKLPKNNFCHRLWKIAESAKSPNLVTLALCASVTRLGDFLTRVAKIVGNLLGYFERHQFLSKTAVDTFWASFSKNWAAFNSNIWSHRASVSHLSHTNQMLVYT